MMDRKEWLSLMATSNGARLAALWEAVGLTPDFMATIGSGLE